ncbi:MAG: RidA family protein [Pseudomonadota bacterium]
MTKRPIKFHMLEQAPKPVAPYSHAVECNGFVFITGQMPNFPEDFERPLPSGIEAQTHQVMHNLKMVLQNLNIGLKDVVQARVYLSQFERDYELMNTAYQSYFAANQRPARTCVGVTALALDALIEVDMVARANYIQ